MPHLSFTELMAVLNTLERPSKPRLPWQKSVTAGIQNNFLRQEFSKHFNVASTDMDNNLKLGIEVAGEEYLGPTHSLPNNVAMGTDGKFYYTRDGNGWGQIILDITRNHEYIGRDGNPLRKTASAAEMRQQLIDNFGIERVPALLEAHNQYPTYLLWGVINGAIIAENNGLPRITPMQPRKYSKDLAQQKRDRNNPTPETTEEKRIREEIEEKELDDGVEHKIFFDPSTNQIYYTSSLKRLPIRPFEGTEPITYIEGPMKVTFRLEYQVDPKYGHVDIAADERLPISERKGQWGYQLVGIEAKDPQVLEMFQGRQFEEMQLTCYRNLISGQMQALYELCTTHCDQLQFFAAREEFKSPTEQKIKLTKALIQAIADSAHPDPQTLENFEKLLVEEFHIFLENPNSLTLRFLQNINGIIKSPKLEDKIGTLEKSLDLLRGLFSSSTISTSSTSFTKNKDPNSDPSSDRSP